MVSLALIDLSRVSVLCIDDDPVIRTIVRGALNQRGCRDIVQAKDGEEALDLCTGRRFDLIICDFHMAPMDGHAFVRELGQRGLDSGRPVVMLSADNDPAVIAEAQALGVSAWLAKPISAHRLVEQVGIVLGLSGCDTADAAATELSDRQNARLMADVMSLHDLLAGQRSHARDRPVMWRAMYGLLHSMADQAGATGYTLVRELAQRGAELLRAAQHDLAAATLHQAEIAQAVTSVATAIERVVRNRLFGDGGPMGVKLMNRLDGFVGPLIAALKISTPPE